MSSSVLDWFKKHPLSTPSSLVTEVKRLGRTALVEDVDHNRRTIVHLALRRSESLWCLDESLMKDLASIDDKAFVRRDIYGATPLHLYMRNTKAPRADIVTALHRLMVATPIEPLDSSDARWVNDGRKGIASRNLGNMTPLHDFFDGNWHCFGPATVRQGDWDQHRDGFMELTHDAMVHQRRLLEDATRAFTPISNRFVSASECVAHAASGDDNHSTIPNKSGGNSGGGNSGGESSAAVAIRELEPKRSSSSRARRPPKKSRERPMAEALVRMTTFAEARDYRGLAEALELAASLPRKRNDHETSLQVTHARKVLPRLRADLERRIVEVVRAVAALDGAVFGKQDMEEERRAMAAARLLPWRVGREDTLHQSASSSSLPFSASTFDSFMSSSTRRKQEGMAHRHMPFARSVQVTSAVAEEQLGYGSEKKSAPPLSGRAGDAGGGCCSEAPPPVVFVLFAKSRLFPELVALVVGLSGLGKSGSKEEWKRVGESFLRNENEALDAPLRLHASCPRFLPGVIDAMNGGEVTARPGRLGPLLIFLMRSVDREETAAFVERLMTLDISVPTDIPKALLNPHAAASPTSKRFSSLDPPTSLPSLSSSSSSSSSPSTSADDADVRSEADSSLNNGGGSSATNLRSRSSSGLIYSLNDSRRDMASFVLQLAALKDANQFFGGSSDMGLRLMARAIEGVERTLHTLTRRTHRHLGEASLELFEPRLFVSPFGGSTAAPRFGGGGGGGAAGAPDGGDDNDDDDDDDDALSNATVEASALATRDAWEDAVCDFVKRLVDDPALVGGILAHATEHATTKLTNTALVRVVLDEKYRRGPRHQYYMEMSLFVALLGCVTLDASLWSQQGAAAPGTIAAIALLLSYFSFRAVSGMLLWRRSELRRLPKHLGFVESGNVGLVASSAGDMAWKILTDQRYRKRYLDGNSGRNGTSVFEPHSQRDLRDLALVYFAATSAQKTAAVAFSLGSLLLTWALVAQLLLRGRGDAPLGVATGFALWIDFFRRLKGATRETASFFLMLSIICRDIFVFVRFLAVILFMFATLFRILLSSDASNYVHNVDDAEVLDTKNIASIIWLVFRATIGDVGNVPSLFPTSLSKLLLVMLLLATWLVLMNVLISIISVSYEYATNISETLFYSARIELLRSFDDPYSASAIFDRLFSSYIPCSPTLADEKRENEQLLAAIADALKIYDSGNSKSIQESPRNKELKNKAKYQEECLGEMRQMIGELRRAHIELSRLIIGNTAAAVPGRSRSEA